jgi:hypothetical protein
MEDPLADAVSRDASIFGRRGRPSAVRKCGKQNSKSIFHISAETENAVALKLPPAPKAEPREGSR